MKNTTRTIIASTLNARNRYYNNRHFDKTGSLSELSETYKEALAEILPLYSIAETITAFRIIQDTLEEIEEVEYDHLTGKVGSKGIEVASC